MNHFFNTSFILSWTDYNVPLRVFSALDNQYLGPGLSSHE